VKSESYRTRRLSKTFCIPSQHEKNDKTRYWYYCDEVSKWILHKGSVHWDDLSNSLSNWKNILSYNSVAMKKAELNQKFKLIKSQKK
jgi:hypothetical protein